MHSAFTVRKDDEELRAAIDGQVEAMWKDGSLYRIKRKYLTPLGIEPASEPPPDR